MEPVGQASKACNADRRSALETGWDLTKDVSAASPKAAGAICRQASQSMQVESTKKSPGTFSGTRFLRLAMTEAPFFSLYRDGLGTEAIGLDGLMQNGPAVSHTLPLGVAEACQRAGRVRKYALSRSGGMADAPDSKAAVGHRLKTTTNPEKQAVFSILGEVPRTS